MVVRAGDQHRSFRASGRLLLLALWPFIALLGARAIMIPTTVNALCATTRVAVPVASRYGVPSGRRSDDVLTLPLLPPDLDNVSRPCAQPTQGGDSDQAVDRESRWMLAGFRFTYIEGGVDCIGSSNLLRWGCAFAQMAGTAGLWVVAVDNSTVARAGAGGQPVLGAALVPDAFDPGIASTAAFYYLRNRNAYFAPANVDSRSVDRYELWMPPRPYVAFGVPFIIVYGDTFGKYTSDNNPNALLTIAVEALVVPSEKHAVHPSDCCRFEPPSNGTTIVDDVRDSCTGVVTLHPAYDVPSVGMPLENVTFPRRLPDEVVGFRFTYVGGRASCGASQPSKWGCAGSPELLTTFSLYVLVLDQGKRNFTVLAPVVGGTSNVASISDSLGFYTLWNRSNLSAAPLHSSALESYDLLLPAPRRFEAGSMMPLKIMYGDKVSSDNCGSLTVRVDALLPEALDIAAKSAYPPHGSCQSIQTTSRSLTQTLTASRRQTRTGTEGSPSTSHVWTKTKAPSPRSVTTSKSDDLTTTTADPRASATPLRANVTAVATPVVATPTASVTTVLPVVHQRSRTLAIQAVGQHRQRRSSMTSVAASVRTTATGLTLLSAIFGKSGVLSVSQASRQRSIERLSVCGADQTSVDDPNDSASFFDFPIQMPLGGSAVSNAIVSSCGALALAAGANLVLYLAGVGPVQSSQPSSNSEPQAKAKGVLRQTLVVFVAVLGAQVVPNGIGYAVALAGTTPLFGSALAVAVVALLVLAGHGVNAAFFFDSGVLVHHTETGKPSLADRDASTKKKFVCAFGPFVDGARDPTVLRVRLYFFEDIGNAVLLATFASLPVAACTAMAAAVILIALAHLLYLLLVRPYRSRIETVFSYGMAATGAAQTGVATWRQRSPASEVAGSLQDALFLGQALLMLAQPVTLLAWNVVHTRQSKMVVTGSSRLETLDRPLLNIADAGAGLHVPCDNPLLPLVRKKIEPRGE